MLQVGFVGLGGIAREHLGIVSEFPKANIAAVCDIVQENAEKAAEQYGANAYTDFDILLECEQLDALFVCVPQFARADIEEKAAQRGIHLFVEKPLGIDMETVKKKAEVLHQSGVIVSTGYCLRYLDIIEKAKQYLVGKQIAMVRANRFDSMYGPLWWRDLSKSGGQLVDQVTHNIDMMMYLAGKIKKVSADMGLTIMKDVPGTTAPDVSSVNVVFESGAIGHIAASYIPQPDYRSSLEIMGNNFRVTIDGIATLTIVEKDQTISYKSNTLFYKEQDEAFLNAILTSDRSLILSSYEEAMNTLEVTLAANESAQTGLSVYL